MDSLKGFMIALLLSTFLMMGVVDVASSAVVISQLQNTGAVITQTVGSSGSYDDRVKKAIELAKEEGIEVKISDTGYKLGDRVEITLEKTIPRYFMGNSEKVSGGGYEGKTETFEIKNSIVITKRGN